MEGERRLLVSLAAVAAVWLCAAAAIGIDSSFLGFAPVFLVLIPLLRGRYVGEDTLHRLRSARAPRTRRRLVLDDPLPGRRPRAAAVRRAGELLGRHVAVRPPPAALIS